MKQHQMTEIENLRKGDRFAFKPDIHKRVSCEVTSRKGMTTFYKRRGKHYRHFKPNTPVMFLRHVTKRTKNFKNV